MKPFEWVEIESEDELRRKYKYNDIYKAVLSDLNIDGVISIKKSFSNLCKFICAIKFFKVKYPINEDKYFISPKHRIAFMILNYNKQFNDQLGITKRHFVDKDKAKQWRNKYMKMFHPDEGDIISDQVEITNAITTIYKRMVGES